MSDILCTRIIEYANRRRGAFFAWELREQTLEIQNAWRKSTATKLDHVLQSYVEMLEGYAKTDKEAGCLLRDLENEIQEMEG